MKCVHKYKKFFHDSMNTLISPNCHTQLELLRFKVDADRLKDRQTQRFIEKDDRLKHWEGKPRVIVNRDLIGRLNVVTIYSRIVILRHTRLTKHSTEVSDIMIAVDDFYV